MRKKLGYCRGEKGPATTKSQKAQLYLTPPKIQMQKKELAKKERHDERMMLRPC